MHCYSCARQARTASAVGVCQWCGGGVCGEHAREIRQAQSPGGLYAMRPIQLVCSRCLAAQHVSLGGHRYHRQRRKVASAVIDLPDARAAVEAAELILRNQQHAVSPPETGPAETGRGETGPAGTGPWQRMRRWLAGLWH